MNTIIHSEQSTTSEDITAVLAEALESWNDLAASLTQSKEDLQLKVAEQVKLIRTRSSVEQRKVLAQEIQALEFEIQELSTLLPKQANRIANLQAQERGEDPNQISLDSFLHPQSHSEGLGSKIPSTGKSNDVFIVPKMLPTFGEGGIQDPEEFLDNFAKVLRAHGLPLDAHWSRLIPLSLKQEENTWIEENIDTGTPWQVLKERFIKHCTHPFQQTTRLWELWQTQPNKGESVKDYASRFQKLMKQCGQKDNDQHLTDRFIFTLPPSVQKDIQLLRISNPLNTYKTVSEVADVVIWLEATLTTANNVNTNRLTTTNIVNTNSINTHKVNTHNPKQDTVCTLHGAGRGHSTENCFTLKHNPKLMEILARLEHDPKTTVPTKNTTQNNTGKAPVYFCYVCNEKGHRYFDCPKKKQNPTPSTSKINPEVKKMNIQEVEDDFEELTLQEYHELFPPSIRMANIQTHTTSKEHSHLKQLQDEISKSFNFPVSILGRSEMAFLDTGTTKSILDITLVKELGLQIIPKQGKVHLACKDISVPRIGITEPALLTCGRHSVTHQFEVQPLSEGPLVVIGQDLFDTLGFSLGGLPVRETSSEVVQEAPVEDTKPSLIPDSPISPQKQAELEEIRAAILKALQPTISANQSIPKNSFCNIPESVVELNTPPGQTTWRRQYPIPNKLESLVDEAVEEWAQNGTIIPAPVNNKFNSPLTLAPKKDAEGNWTLKRPCLDPRHLNKLLEDDCFPIPLIRDIFSALSGGVLYTSLDAVKAYHRLMIHPKDQHKTAFTWRGKQWMFQGAPFGLKVLTSKFQRVMMILLGDLPYVFVYVDDIVIVSHHIDDHLHHVQEVIERLTKANFLLNIEKCHFAVPELLILGFIISKDGQRIDPNKLVNIDEWAEPKTGKEVQHYLGLFNYFREHIPLVSTLMAPLEPLRYATNITSLWKTPQAEAFCALKSLLPQLPPLVFPDFTRPFCVATDASNTGIGAVLYQTTNDIYEQPHQVISFQARALQQSELKYSATKKELLAVVFALNKFHYYLWDNHFTLFTDHRALVFIHSQKNLNPMLHGWLDTLLNYNFTIIHRPGILNILPDHLSRIFPSSVLEYNKITNDDHDISACISVIQQVDPLDFTEPPKEDQTAMVKTKHLLGHFGADALIRGIHQDGFHWPSIKQDCLNVIKSCVECQRFNITRHGFHPLKAIHAELPLDHVAMDLAGPFTTSDVGNHYALVIVDVCTRFVFLRALKNKFAVTIAQTLLTLFCDIGFPKIIQSDNGTEFVNQVVAELTRLSHIDHRLITPYHPQANGVAERNIQTMLNIIRKSIKGTRKDWDLYLPATQLAMNTKVVSLHKSTPFSLMFGRQFNGFTDFSSVSSEPLSPEQLQDRLEYLTKIVYPAISGHSSKVQEHMIKRFKGVIKTNPFPDGAFVMVEDITRNNKMAPRYEGPFKVIRCTKGGSYVLQDNTGSLLPRNYPPSALKPISHDPITQDKSYEVEAILNHRGEDSNRQYLVKWKGYDTAHNSWEPVGNFDDVAVIDKYWQRKEERRM
jgi:transposase InsO family protein